VSISGVAYLLPPNILLQLYYTLINPYLIYYNLIWPSNYPSRLINLNILQRKALHAILGFSWTYQWHSSDLFSTTGLTMTQTNFCQTNEFMYTNNVLPQVFINQFQQIIFLLSIRIIFTQQLIINQSFVVSMLGNSVLDTRDPQPGMIHLTAFEQ